MIKKLAKKQAKILYHEELEPRVLFSADVVPNIDSIAVQQVLVEDVAGAAQTASTPITVNAEQSHLESATDLVVVNSNVTDYQQLVNGIQGEDSNRTCEVIVLDADRDGIEQISDILKNRSDLDAIHLITHGADGQINLGSCWLNATTLSQNADAVAAWGKALTDEGDILFYGCNIAAAADGQTLLNNIAGLTGADVAASEDLTGNAAQGGNWNLEYQRGQIDTQLVIDTTTQQAWQGVLSITANGTASSAKTNGATSLTWSHTVAAGSNTALFVELAIDGLGAPATSVTYGGVPMTQVGRSTGNHAVEIWVLTSPTVGTANIVATFAGTTPVSAGATAFNGVNQVTPTGTFAGATGTGTTSSVTVSSATGELVIDAEYWRGTAGGYTAGAGQTQQWTQTNTNNTGMATTEAGAASVTMSSSVTASTQWEIGAVSIKSAPEQIVNTVPGAQTTAEDTMLVFSSGNGNAISINGAVGENLSVDLSVTNGTLTLSGTSGLSFSVGDGTSDASMTFSGAIEDINTALEGLSYVPTADYNGGATLTLSTFDSDFYSLNIDAALSGRYTFDDSGSLGNDDSGNGNTGTVVGATSYSDSERADVLSLDGNDYVQISGEFGNPANVTLAGWVNLTSADSGGSDLISIGDSLAIRLDESGKGINGFFYNGSTWQFVNSNQYIAGTGWHHVAYTFDDTNNVHTLYIDGTEVASAQTFSHVSYSGLGSNTFIGKHGNGDTTFDLTGFVDDVRVYDRALIGSEIASLAMTTPSDTDNVSINVTSVNDAPIISSNGGGATAAVEVAENTTAVTTVTATDVDLDMLTYSITAGADAAKFNINSSTGELTFASAPNFESPADANTDNVYEVTVQADDGNGGTDTQEISVTVTDVDEFDVTAPADTDATANVDGDSDTDVSTHETQNEDTFTQEESIPPVKDHLITLDPSNVDDSQAVTKNSKAVDTEEIIYLTDENDMHTQSDRREDDDSYIYFDNDLYKEINSSKYLDLQYASFANESVSPSGDDIVYLDSESNDSTQLEINGDYDLLRHEIDESFNSDLKSKSLETKIVSITSASLTVGIVSYLLRAGSMVTSLISSLPLWRGFDPIAIFIGNKKKRKDQDKIPDNKEIIAETIFDEKAK